VLLEQHDNKGKNNMNKERYRKCIEKKRLLYKGKLCENCGKDHDHSYGTGRFCSKQCKNEFVGK
jgi:hypothetical protein